MKKHNLNPEIREHVCKFYRNVKHLREQRGISTKEFADIIGISEKKLIISEACPEEGYFHAGHIEKIYSYFNVKVDDLFTGDF